MKQVYSKPVYVAFDGTEFLDEEECLTYEERAEKQIEKSRFWDEERYPLSVVDFSVNPMKIGYMVVDNEKEANIIEYILKEDDVSTPWEDLNIECQPGIYYYDDDQGSWRDFVEEFEEMIKLKEMFAGS